jgi:hypothetical protein
MAGLLESVDRKGLRRQFRPGRPAWKSFSLRKRDELRTQADHLGARADQFDHALQCPSRNVFDCEHFRATLDDAFPVGGASRTSPT